MPASYFSNDIFSVFPDRVGRNSPNRGLPDRSHHMPSPWFRVPKFSCQNPIGADWSGRERTSGPKRFDRLIYCKRKKYSDKETDGWPNIYRNHYPDMRMIRCRSGEIYNSKNKYVNKSTYMTVYRSRHLKKSLFQLFGFWYACVVKRLPFGLQKATYSDGSDLQNAGDENTQGSLSSDSHGLAYFHLRR